MTALRYVLWFVVVFAAAALGAKYMPGAWYAELKKPTWNPPNWVFGPVWSLLYICMATAAGMVSNQAASAQRNSALGLFVVQMVLNSLWSYIFFGLQKPGLAFGEICLMWVAIAATVVAFARVSPPAAYLMVPYLCWVTFASVLNCVIWRLNVA